MSRRRLRPWALLFANLRGGHIDFRSYGQRHWKPAQVAAGVEPLRHLYDLRHTYATFALRAGVSVFAVSRFMGLSIAPYLRRGSQRRSRGPRENVGRFLRRGGRHRFASAKAMTWSNAWAYRDADGRGRSRRAGARLVRASDVG
jgi:hypothetical protein